MARHAVPHFMFKQFAIRANAIATEQECVEELWHDENDRMDSNKLLAELMRHIKAVF